MRARALGKVVLREARNGYLDLDGAERILRAQVLANPADRLRNAARRVDVIILRVCTTGVSGKTKTKQVIGDSGN
jgi:hypothetical protein